jgi:hypothetical protein
MQQEITPPTCDQYLTTSNGCSTINRQPATSTGCSTRNQYRLFNQQLLFNPQRR